ncbi:phosphopeptide-binding protein [Mycobacteroides franklinii]|uniref:Phosphopeptide-binding protein n=1 Tax=Mycobacteroides franklinii TaxID=948102 RepID=A0A1S1LHJ1_9MYCO|nr:MPT63 family protein [Mycobacteroides franklinii]OHU31463.1 phosphopeptide-binding protein [Mycobacteroides franklinii]
MKINVPITAAVVAAAAAAGLALMPTAGADTTLGQQGRLTNGDVVQAWTISDLKVSADQLPYQPKGTLWEATATDEAVQGSVIPIVANFNAKAKDGETYRVLYGVATEQGVNPGTLSQGEKTTGKIYFDVTGANPETVTYTSGDEDLLTWKAAPPAAPAQRSGGSGQSHGTNPAPATSTAPTPTPAAVPAGSQGTPLPAGSQGTPVDEQQPATTSTPTVAPVTATPTPATPVPGAEGTPLNNTAVPASPAPATPAPASPAPASPAPGVPAVEGAAPQTVTPPVAAVPGVPAVPASDSTPHGQRAAGSQGTPVPTEG